MYNKNRRVMQFNCLGYSGKHKGNTYENPFETNKWDVDVEKDEPHDIPTIYIEAVCPVCDEWCRIRYDLGDMFEFVIDMINEKE